MTTKEDTEYIKKKLKCDQPIGQLPRESKSVNENLMSLFRTMWNTNLLLKNMIDSNAVSEAKHSYKSCVYMDSIFKDLYKNIWKLNLLLKHMRDSNTVSEAKHDYKSYVHMDSTLKDLYKNIWKLNSLLLHELRIQT